MRMRPLNAQSNLDNAKRALGREVGMLRGFVGIGLGANEIRLYVEDFETLDCQVCTESVWQLLRWTCHPTD